jgi:GT2 family glycosyltransferase
MSCVAVHRTSPDIPILVIDASATGATRHVCERISHQHAPSLRLMYRRAQQPGLARQRNEAIGICRELDAEIVHFIDDDTEVSAGYFDAIERRFRQEPTVMGVGGIVVNQPHIDYVAIKSLFLLASRRHGSVLRSGRNMMGQYPGANASDQIDWLCGCSMSYRTTAFDEVMFDSRLMGYSLGEDYDFGFRLSRRHRLIVEPAATCTHYMTQSGRKSVRLYGRQRTLITYCWVSEYRDLGLSRIAFWWSTLGDVMLHVGHWIVTWDTESFQETLGVLGAIATIVRNRAQLDLGASSLDSAPST